MKESYRINVRFDLGNEKEARAAELLKCKESRSRNRFIIEAILNAIDGKNNCCLFSPDELRRILREELKGVFGPFHV